MPNHLTFSTDQNEINQMGNGLKVGEEILLNMTAQFSSVQSLSRVQLFATP